MWPHDYGSRLLNLTIKEANRLALIAAEIAECDFKVEFVNNSNGELEYEFIPKDMD